MDEEIRRLRNEVSQLRLAIEQLQRQGRASSELGAPRKPVTALYILDPDTKAVAKVGYSRKDSGLTTTEV